MGSAPGLAGAPRSRPRPCPGRAARARGCCGPRRGSRRSRSPCGRPSRPAGMFPSASKAQPEPQSGTRIARVLPRGPPRTWRWRPRHRPWRAGPRRLHQRRAAGAGLLGTLRRRGSRPPRGRRASSLGRRAHRRSYAGARANESRSSREGWTSSRAHDLLQSHRRAFAARLHSARGRAFVPGALHVEHVGGLEPLGVDLGERDRQPLLVEHVGDRIQQTDVIARVHVDHRVARRHVVVDHHLRRTSGPLARGPARQRLARLPSSCSALTRARAARPRCRAATLATPLALERLARARADGRTCSRSTASRGRPRARRASRSGPR